MKQKHRQNVYWDWKRSKERSRKLDQVFHLNRNHSISTPISMKAIRNENVSGMAVTVEGGWFPRGWEGVVLDSLNVHPVNEGCRHRHSHPSPFLWPVSKSFNHVSEIHYTRKTNIADVSAENERCVYVSRVLLGYVEVFLHFISSNEKFYCEHWTTFKEFLMFMFVIILMKLYFFKLNLKTSKYSPDPRGCHLLIFLFYLWWCRQAKMCLQL